VSSNVSGIFFPRGKLFCWSRLGVERGDIRQFLTSLKADGLRMPSTCISNMSMIILNTYISSMNNSNVIRQNYLISSPQITIWRSSKSSASRGKIARTGPCPFSSIRMMTARLYPIGMPLALQYNAFTVLQRTFIKKPKRTA
jgi:hypothetical protein